MHVSDRLCCEVWLGTISPSREVVTRSEKIQATEGYHLEGSMPRGILTLCDSGNATRICKLPKDTNRV